MFAPVTIRRGDKAGFADEHDCLGAVAEAELGEDAADVSLGGLFGDDESTAR